jgi:hypothetical protein
MLIFKTMLWGSIVVAEYKKVRDIAGVQERHELVVAPIDTQP